MERFLSMHVIVIGVVEIPAFKKAYRFSDNPAVFIAYLLTLNCRLLTSTNYIKVISATLITNPILHEYILSTY